MYRKSPDATGADITSLSIHFCQSTSPVFRSNAAIACVAPGGLGLPPSASCAGYDVNTRPSAIVGALVRGSPSHHDQSCSPESASTAKIVRSEEHTSELQ